jgi:hypothetical protein
MMTTVHELSSHQHKKRNLLRMLRKNLFSDSKSSHYPKLLFQIIFKKVGGIRKQALSTTVHAKEK